MKKSRREFLLNTGCGLGMVSLATQMRHFGLMSALAQKSEEKSAVPGDYRALVCVFFAGGNDGNNMVIPNHNDATISNYAVYNAARGGNFALAIPQANLLPITVPRMGNLTYGLHPSLGTVTGGINNGIHELWAQGRLAVVPNVGTLVQPTTRTQYLNKSVPLPYQLFSHSDQVSQYQAGRADTASFTGWGGRVSDKRSALDNPGALLPMITSINGAQLFTAGQSTFPVAINNAGTPLDLVLNPNGFNGTAVANARKTALLELLQQDLSSQVVASASHVTNLAQQANNALQTWNDVTVTFPNTNFGNQLKQVARLIKKRTDLGVNRQIFYVQIGSFDTHANQNTNNGQIGLLSQFSQAARSFYDELIQQGLQNNVTMFTMSDFGRTMNPAGSGAGVGTDHAWGNHMLVMGGGLIGSDFYGMNSSNGTPFPQLVYNAADDSDSGTGARGRWLPATSVEQYAATLSRWYGLPDADLPAVFPKIPNFANTNLGFMQPPA